MWQRDFQLRETNPSQSDGVKTDRAGWELGTVEDDELVVETVGTGRHHEVIEESV